MERCLDSPLERFQVVGRRKYRKREAVSEFTSGRDEGQMMLVNSLRRNLDSKGVSLTGKSCAARPREGQRHVLSKFRRAVNMKITIEDRK